METILLPSPLILEEGIMLVQGIKDKGSSRDSKMEERVDASIVTCLATMLGSVLIEGIHLGMMTTNTATILEATEIKGMAGSTTKEKGMLPLLNMEMVDLPKDQETPSMMNLML